jgi:hypothetical protein
MKTTTRFASPAIATLLVVRLCAAQDAPVEERNWWGRTYVPPPEPELFLAHEIHVDAFGTYTAPETKFSHLFQTDIRDDGVWGGGAGMNYFLTRHLGFGADLNIGNNDGNFVDLVSASLFARLPIEKLRLAPYAFGGGGRTTDQVWEWTRHAGLGLELRTDREIGIFLDGRYLWADRSSDRLLLRAGVRFAF